MILLFPFVHNVLGRAGASESVTLMTQFWLPIGHCVLLGEILHLSELQFSYLKKVRKIHN